MKAGDLVIVNCEGGKPGTVKGIMPNELVAVGLVNEGRRVDHWHPELVRACSAADAVAAAKKFLPARLGGSA